MCEGVLSHRRQSAPLTVLMPNEVLSAPATFPGSSSNSNAIPLHSPKVSRTCGICVTFQYPVAWFLFSYFFIWRFPPGACVCSQESRGKCEDATWKVASHKSKCSPLFGFGFWLHSFLFLFSHVSPRLGLWAVYLAGCEFMVGRVIPYIRDRGEKVTPAANKSKSVLPGTHP